MTIGGKDARCYFFVFKKLDTRYFGKDIPTFTKEEEESHAQFFLKCIVGGRDGTTTFSDIWSRRVSSKLVATEESRECPLFMEHVSASGISQILTLGGIS